MISDVESPVSTPAGKRQYHVPLLRGPRLRLDPHPDSPDPADPNAVQRWVRDAAADGPTAIDLFCGAGGLSLGLNDAGFTVLVGADSDPYSIETHRHNMGGLSYQGDLTDPKHFLEQLDTWGIRTVDLVAGGVPCQPFSAAGRSKIRSLVKANIRSDRDPRAGLWHSFIEIVKALEPRAVLLENVPGLAEWEEGAVLVGFCESLQELGYWTDPTIVAAYEYQVPQHRTRLFIVGLRKRSTFEWPLPHSGERPTVERAIGDLPKVPGGHRQEIMDYRPPEQTSALLRRLRRDMKQDEREVIFDHITRSVRPDDAEAFALLRPGQTYDQLPKRLQRYRSDIFSDKYKRLAWDELSRTITAHIARDGYWYIHPQQDRTLSIREAARIQTFPDWFRFAGEPSHRYRQIGNAVPPLLAEAIGERLYDALTRRGRPPVGTPRTGFRADLMRWHSANARTFPWRAGVSPWHVLMAEMCLHRTRADQVVPVFRSLVQLAPTPADMVTNADSAREAMASLGLRWRMENVIAVAKALVDEFAGQVPCTRAQLIQLPGVGDYVASAVLTFGFARPNVLIDTNTMRIVSRVIGEPKMDTWQMRVDLYRLAGREGANAAFNYALLDLGALVCRSTSPHCSDCPVRRHCAHGQSRL